MQKNTFEEIRQEAVDMIESKGELDYFLKRSILNTSEYIQNSSQLPVITQILSEIICAEKSLDIFVMNTGSYFETLPFTMLDTAKAYLGKDKQIYKNEIERLCISWDGFCDGVAEYEFNTTHDSLFFYPPDIDNSKKDKPQKALLAVRSALTALCNGEAHLYNDVPNNFKNDSEDQLAVEWLSEVTPLSKKEFWLWYVNEAIPQAIAEAPHF